MTVVLAASAARELPASEQAERWAQCLLGREVREPMLRVWTDTCPTLILGRGQKEDDALAARADSREMAVVHRLSGGGAVLAGPWLLCSIAVLPPRHPLVLPSIPDSFRWAGYAHADWLGGLGIPATCKLPATVQSDRSMAWACFGNTASWEVEADGRKIVGLAQARSGNGVILASAVLVEPAPWALLCEVMGKWIGYATLLSQHTASCAQFIHAPLPAHALEGSLLEALERAVAG